MKYEINYNTGAGDETVTGTLENAMEIADKGAAYTQQDITIRNEGGEVVARRHWWGVEYDEANPEESPICFGSCGYYGDWFVM